MNDKIFVTKDAGWPILVAQEEIFGDLTDSEFRILCAYRARDEHNHNQFDRFAERYDSKRFAEIILMIRRAQQ